MIIATNTSGTINGSNTAKRIPDTRQCDKYAKVYVKL